jgi:hypothetical protein
MEIIDLGENGDGFSDLVYMLYHRALKKIDDEGEDTPPDESEDPMWSSLMVKNERVFIAFMDFLSGMLKGGRLLNPERRVPRSWDYFLKIVVPAQAGIWKEIDPRSGRVMHVLDTTPETLNEAYLQENFDSKERAKIRAHHRDKTNVRTLLIDEEKDLMKRRGFPYSPSYDEYIRFLQNNFSEVNIGETIISFSQILELFIPSPVNADDFKKGHSYIVGRGGSGKSELLKKITEKLGGFCVVVDPHGDLADDICKFKKGYIYRIAPHEKRFVINPFDIQDKSQENRELVAQEITDLIAELVEDSGLSRLMTTVIFPIVYTLLKLPYSDFKMLTDCINPSAGKERLKSLRGLVEVHHRAIWSALEDDTYDTSKQSVFNRLQSLLNYRLIGQTLCGIDDFEDSIARAESGGTLVVSIPIPEIGEAVAVALGKFFMTRMQIWAKRRNNIPVKDRIPVCLIVDEFHNFLSHSTAVTLDQFGRKFRLFMILAHQHIQQITDREIRGSVLANTINKIAGMSNSETRQTLAKEMQIEAEELENLRPGHFVARLGNREAFPFYSRLVKLDRGRKVTYIESENAGELVDGWEGHDTEQNTYASPQTETPKTPRKPTPKFEF